MSTMVDGAERARVIRRRHLLERQAVIFGGLITALLALSLIGLAVWFGAVPSPVNVPFVTPDPEDSRIAQPCPPEGATAERYSDILINVYNGTTRGGLAAATAAELADRGLKIGARANDPFGRYDGATLIRTGPAGVSAAYTVAELFPDAVVQLDAREDGSIDVTLGRDYDQLRPPGEARLAPGTPIEPPVGCFPVGEDDGAAGSGDGAGTGDGPAEARATRA